MLVLDTSALMAVLQEERKADAIAEALQQGAGATAMSAGTMVECWVVARRRGVLAEMRELLADIAPRIVPVDEAAARRIETAYARWGGGPARLNFGDMFAYDLATSLDAPLLYVGEDFARTDVRSAL
jgi:ribonuclease VapC